MVGCWFTGQGKKGDCVGKKVNGGPVTQSVLNWFISQVKLKSQVGKFPAVRLYQASSCEVVPSFIPRLSTLGLIA